jgi:hypothetical protein
MRTRFTIFSRKPGEQSLWEVQALVGRWNQNISYRKWGCGLYSPPVSGYDSMRGCCKHCNKTSASIRAEKFLYQMSNYQFSKKAYVSRNCFLFFLFFPDGGGRNSLQCTRVLFH